MYIKQCVKKLVKLNIFRSWLKYLYYFHKILVSAIHFNEVIVHFLLISLQKKINDDYSNLLHKNIREAKK